MSIVWNHFLTAVMLLTRIPVGRWCVHSPEAVAASVIYFPIVGALVGTAGALALGIAISELPGPVAVLLSMLTTVLLTGAYHEDGLADAADGLFGGTTPSRRLEIMKDSRIGNFGAIALWFNLSAKFLLLDSLLSKGLLITMSACVASHSLARASAVAMLHLQPHVGSDSSRSQPFCRRLTQAQLAGSLSPACLLALAFYHTAAVPIIAANALLIFLAARFFQNRLGGITGDCLGATVQISEITTLTLLLGRL
jgi:adenosylcobinamide-GDP ribazoletransferase